MRIKKVNISVVDYDACLKVLVELNTMEIIPYKLDYDIAWGGYDLYTEMNVDQTKAMLNFVKEHKLGFIWKGES